LNSEEIASEYVKEHKDKNIPTRLYRVTRELIVPRKPYQDVHTRHCCKKCGCKYGEDQPIDEFIGCTVVAGVTEQEKPCGQQCVCYENSFDEET
jgi:hypothetical protein